MRVPVPVQLSVALPSLVFQDYEWTLQVRVVNLSTLPLVDLALSFSSPVFPRANVERTVLRPGETWESSLPLKAERSGLFRVEASLRFRAGDGLWEVLEGLIQPWRVRGNPRTDRNVTFNLSDIPVGMSDRAGFGQMVDGGMHLGHNITLDAGRIRDVEAFMDELEHFATPREVVMVRQTPEMASFANSLDMPLVALQAGRYLRGSPLQEPGRSESADEELRHEVMLTRPFWLGRYPVRQRDWRRLMESLGTSHEAMAGDELPAQGMSWVEASEFCRRLTQREVLGGTIPVGYAYRLPTEAEWEYACRAGSQESRYGPCEKVAVIADHNTGIQPVGGMKPNGWGIYDMLGNVFEWCLDAYAPYRRALQMDPLEIGEKGGARVVRGGCFQSGEEYARAAARLSLQPDRRSGRVGFRVVLAEETHEPFWINREWAETMRPEPSQSAQVQSGKTPAVPGASAKEGRKRRKSKR